MDDRRWDADMVAARRQMEALAAQYPPVAPREPFDQNRLINDALNLHWVQGGPEMAESHERWVFARGRRVLCRVNIPQGPRPAAGWPTLIWFHGGGWVWSSVDTHDRLCREYAAGASVATVSVDYALSPEAKFPQALHECAAVVRWLQSEGEIWGLDTSRLGIGGDSAGGNLAIATALLLRDDRDVSLSCLLTAYPVTDCRFDTPSYIEFADGFGLTRAQMRAYWNLYLRDAADQSNPLAAPYRADLAGLPPTLVQVAELDVLRSDGEKISAKMKAAGVDATLETYPGVAHGFMRLTGAVGRAREAVASASAWLTRHLVEGEAAKPAVRPLARTARRDAPATRSP